MYHALNRGKVLHVLTRLTVNAARHSSRSCRLFVVPPQGCAASPEDHPTQGAYVKWYLFAGTIHFRIPRIHLSHLWAVTVLDGFPVQAREFRPATEGALQVLLFRITFAPARANVHVGL